MTPASDGKKRKRTRAAPAKRRGQKQGSAPLPGSVERLAGKLDIVPRRPKLFLRALTHKSAEQELGFESNERLEFLGDAVLDLVLAEHLCRSHPDLAEGDLTKLKAVAVSEPILAAVGRDLEVGRFLLLAKGEELTGGRDRSSILADSVEAIFAAVYLDRGYRVTRALILRLLADHLAAIERREYEPDYKTLLQERIQEIHRTPPTYRVVSQSGPDHDRTFVAEARIGRQVLGRGTGKSKKQAEQAAARQALQEEE
jgi:ribonuclease-3